MRKEPGVGWTHGRLTAIMMIFLMGCVVLGRFCANHRSPRPKGRIPPMRLRWPENPSCRSRIPLRTSQAPAIKHRHDKRPDASQDCAMDPFRAFKWRILDGNTSNASGGDLRGGYMTIHDR